MSRLFTSESVSEGHPVNICDQVSAAILDAILAQDKDAHVACETLVKTGLILVAGEVTTSANVDFEAIARKTVCDIGYDNSEVGFDGHYCAFLNGLGKQSPDINQGVSRALPEDQGAGDQGLMFGFATNETEHLMPAAITYAHELVKKQATLRRNGSISWLRPDAKSQVTIAYNDDGTVDHIDTIVLSTQHDPDVTQETVHEAVYEEIIKKVIPANLLRKDTKIFINPTGRFVIGGPVGDAGVTGRKIIVDTYGGAARHGGGAFSGKDPSKVDRSAAYAARYVAKNIVAAGLAKKAEVQVSYAIGVAQPVSVSVNTFGTGKIDDEKISKAIPEVFDLRPYGLIKQLDLLRPIYLKTATYGHFGRPSFSWEQTNKVDDLLQAVK